MDVTVRVLIVDDQAPFRRVAREVVEHAGDFEVVGEASSGEESVTLARELRPDLILMDVNLPGIDGTEATRQILAERGDATVLLVSTYEESEYEPRAAECGAIGYVTKSRFDPDRLAEVWASASG
ncbi:MAG: response regulator [Actinomycetota bacterium]